MWPAKLGRKLYEVPVGFKWFVDGLLDGSLGFGGEESAGASFLRRDGTVWTTDKDGIVAGLAGGRDHGADRIAIRANSIANLTREFGDPVYDRVEAPATPDEKRLLATLSPQQVKPPSWRARRSKPFSRARLATTLPIGGMKVIAEERLVRGAAVGDRETSTRSTPRASGARIICGDLVDEAQKIVGDALATAKAPQRSKGRPVSALSEGTP